MAMLLDTASLYRL